LLPILQALFIFVDEDTVEYELSYNTSNIMYSQSSQTFQLPSSTYTLDDIAANFQDTLCNSSHLVWSSTEDVLLNQKDVIMYPNPSSDFLNIEGAVAGDRIEIWDLEGRNLLNNLYSEGKSISLTHLNSGIYMVKVIRNGEPKLIEKLQKY
jgi:hypothetical protein